MQGSKCTFNNCSLIYEDNRFAHIQCWRMKYDIFLHAKMIDQYSYFLCAPWTSY